MRKKIKFILCILLILSINFTSFATVGANDGSAFVTKSEFDALVNTFNEQMDDYEESLVTKIDGAIANYLAGLSSESTNALPSIINNIDLNDRTFLNNTAITAIPDNGSYFKMFTSTFACVSYTNYASTINNYEGYVLLNSYDYNYITPTYSSNADNANQWKLKYRKITKDGVDYISPLNDSYVWKVVHRILCLGAVVLRNNTSVAANYPSTTSWTINSTIKKPGSENVTLNIWNNSPSCILSHSTEFVNSTLTFDFLKLLPGGVYPSKYNKVWYGINYDDRYEFNSDSTTYGEIYGGGPNGAGAAYIRAGGSLNQRKTDKFKYTFYYQKVYSPNIYGWINYSASELAEDIIYKTDGLPLCTVKDDCKITVPLNITNSVGKSTVAISATRFDKNPPSESKKDTYAYFNGSAGDLTMIEFNHTGDGRTETTYWLKVIPNNAGATASVKLDGDIIQYISE